MKTLVDYKEIINHKPIHIATVNKDNNPNLSVASDNILINENTLITSVNEMVNTQVNVKYNNNVVITAFDEEWKGVRIWGNTEFVTTGEYYDLCNKTFFGNGEVSPFGATKPKGVLITHITKVEDFV